MRPRYGAIVLAAGMLAAALALVSPAGAENPMTPLRPATPPESADRAAASSALTVRSVPAEGVASAQQSIGPEAAPPAPAVALSSLPGEAADTATPRARRDSRRDRAAGELKPGRWEFTARLQPPVAAVRAAAGGMQTTYSACIEADNAVPADLGQQCRLERHERQGSLISWSMNCSDTGVRSEGLAEYRGDTMRAAVVSHIPGPSGKVTDMTQHLTGRYLGPCLPPTAAIAPTGSAPADAPAAQASGSPVVLPGQSPTIAPVAGSPALRAGSPLSATDSAAADAQTAETPTAAKDETASRHIGKPRRHLRQGRHAHRAHRRYRSRGAYQAGYRDWSRFGPNPYSSAGP